MKHADIDTLLQRVALRAKPDGDTTAPRWVYRPHPQVPKTLHNKPVPRATPPGSRTVYFIAGTTYALCEYCTPLLQGAAGATDITALDPLTVHTVQSAIDTIHKVTPNNVWTEIRDLGLRETVRQIMERSGLEGFQVVPAVAELFEVSPLVVRRAMGGTEAEGRAKPAEYKHDPRWRALVGEVQRAKSAAYSRDVVRGSGTVARYGKFDTEDLLIKHHGDRLFPERCPLLGLPLIYDRHSYPKDNRLIAIVRRDMSRPMASDNVVLVSRKAYKLLETRSKPETAEEVAALDAWGVKKAIKPAPTQPGTTDTQTEAIDLT